MGDWTGVGKRAFGMVVVEEVVICAWVRGVGCGFDFG